MQATSKQLSTIFVFSRLSNDALLTFAAASQIEIFECGEIVIHEGDRFREKFHAVLTGELLAKKITASGKETILRCLPAGEMFAAPALFGDGLAIATVEALTQSEVVTVEKAALLRAIQAHPEVAMSILHCFNTRLQEMHHMIHGLISERAIVRLSKMIQYAVQRYGMAKSGDHHCLNRAMPYQQLSRSIGITYEECVRLVNRDLKHVIRYERGGKITILDAIALENLASQ